MQGFNDPTEQDRYNPYMNVPVTPPPPPPPTAKRRDLLVIWLISVLSVFLILATAITIVLVNSLQSHHFVPNNASANTITAIPTATATLMPTPIPTPTATPIPTPTVQTPIIGTGVAPYSASQIIGDFYRAGLTPSTYKVDTNWSCCTYYPEGGAGYWTDIQTGISMDLATFASIDEVQIDGKDLADKGYKAYVQNYCLLSFGGNPSDLQSYLDIMAQACTY